MNFDVTIIGSNSAIYNALILPDSMNILEIDRTNNNLLLDESISSFGIIYVFAVASTVDETLGLYRKIEISTSGKRLGIGVMLSTITLARFARPYKYVVNSYYQIKKESDLFAKANNWSKIYLGWHFDRFGYPWCVEFLGTRLFLCEKAALPPFLDKEGLERLIGEEESLKDTNLYYHEEIARSLFLPKGTMTR